MTILNAHSTWPQRMKQAGHAAGKTGLDKCSRPGLDDVDHENGKLLLQHVEGGRRRRVARNDNRLHVVLLDQAPGQLSGELAYLALPAWPVWVPPGVADVDQVLRRQQVDDGAGHSEPTEATVEHPDRSVHLATHIDGPGYGSSDVLRSTITC